MNLTPEQKRIIEGVIGVVEVGRQTGGYDNISIFADGPKFGNGKVEQITYGRFQTTEYGNLPTLLNKYVAAGGVYAAQILPYIPKSALRPRSVLVNDRRFKELLKAAGGDPIMQKVQEEFFDEIYFKPAMRWADANGFVRALSALVIFDSYIHSGSIRQDIRKKFPEVPPAKGGDEGAWIRAYVRARQNWLIGIGLKATTYRTRCYTEQIDKANWDLSQLPIKVNGVLVR